MYLYLFRNTVNGKGYVGITSRQVNKRLMEHLYVAKSGTTMIARALKKYGRDAFALRVIGRADTWEELCLMEQAAIVDYNTFKPHGYNLTQGGDGALGRRHTDEAKRQMSEKNKGKVHDQAFRDAVSARFRGVPKSPEQRQKMGEWQRGEHNSQYGKTPAHHAKMLAAAAQAYAENGHPHKGKPLSPEHRAKLVLASQRTKGRVRSPEEQARRSQAMLGKTHTEATRAKISARVLAHLATHEHPLKGRTLSTETRQRISDATQGRPAWNTGLKTGPLSEETKAKLSDALQGHPAWNKGIPWSEITGGKEHPKSRMVEYNGVQYVSVMDCHRQTGLARNTIRIYIRQGKARYVEPTA